MMKLNVSTAIVNLSEHHSTSVPNIIELPLEVGVTVVLYTDGITYAGDRVGASFDVCMLLRSLLEDQEPSCQEIADNLLNQAIRLDEGRPNDDMSVVVLRVLPQETDCIRRMTVRLPVTHIPPLSL